MLMEGILALRQSLWIDTADDPAAACTSIGEALSRSAEKWADDAALAFVHQPAIGDFRWTFGELDRLSDEFYHILYDCSQML